MELYNQLKYRIQDYFLSEKLAQFSICLFWGNHHPLSKWLFRSVHHILGLFLNKLLVRDIRQDLKSPKVDKRKGQ